MLKVTQLVKKFPAFYGNRRFITVFTTALHWLLSWDRRIQLTNCMKQNPSSEADSQSASQEILRLLWNHKFHYRVYKTWHWSLLEPHVFPPSFREIRLNIILPSNPRSSEWYLLLRFSDQIFMCISHLLFCVVYVVLKIPSNFEALCNISRQAAVLKIRNFNPSRSP